MCGQKFGRLTVLSFAGVRNGRAQLVHCHCDCGTPTVVAAASLNAGKTRSCGCARREACSLSNRKHGLTHSPEYTSWRSAKQRCENPSDKDHHRYGARGIRMCERWLTFELFLADMGPRPPGTSIERLENSKGYEPGNCVWATPTEQSRNRRSVNRYEYNGESLALVEVAERAGVPHTRLKSRIKRGMSLTAALALPYAPGGSRLLERGKALDERLSAIDLACRLALRIRPLVVRARFAAKRAEILAPLTEVERRVVLADVARRIPAEASEAP